MSGSDARSLYRLRLLEAALSLALLALALAFRDWPLVDLPQHAWQVASWLRIDALHPSVDSLELHFRTPYLLAYPFAWALAHVVPVVVAWKLTLVLAVALQARALRFLCSELGHDPWLGLLGFPLGLGYAFCWGFVSYCAAVPLVYLAFAFTARHRRLATWQSGVRLSLTLAALLVAHGVALAFTCLVLAPALLQGARRFWHRLWPLLSVPLVALVWLVPAGSATRYGGDDWSFQAWRWLELPGQLVGIGSADAWAMSLGLALLLILASSVGNPLPRLASVPLVLSLLGYGLFPAMFRGAGPLWPRFVTLLVPSLLLAFPPRATSIARAHCRRGATLSLSVAVLGLFASRLPTFQRETGELRALLDDLPPGLSVRPIVFERGGFAFPGTPAHLHLPAYYAAEREGDAGYSFAMYSISVVQWKSGTTIKMGGGAEWTPEAFDAGREAAGYDYFLVRSAEDRTLDLFPGPDPAAVLDGHAGWWWRYRRTPQAASAHVGNAALDAANH